MFEGQASGSSLAGRFRHEFSHEVTSKPSCGLQSLKGPGPRLPGVSQLGPVAGGFCPPQRGSLQRAACLGFSFTQDGNHSLFIHNPRSDTPSHLPCSVGQKATRKVRGMKLYLLERKRIDTFVTVFLKPSQTSLVPGLSPHRTVSTGLLLRSESHLTSQYLICKMDIKMEAIT